MTRDPVYNFPCCLASEVGDKWRHNDVTVEKVSNVDQSSRNQTAMESVWSVSKWSTESVGSRRELVANAVDTAPTPTRRDWMLSRVGVGGVYWVFLGKIFRRVSL